MNEVSVTWTLSGEGAAPEGFYVLVSGPEGFTKTVPVPASADSAVVSGLRNGVEYSFAVVAATRDGSAAPSAAVTATPSTGMEGVVAGVIVEFEPGSEKAKGEQNVPGEDRVAEVDLTVAEKVSDEAVLVEFSEPVDTGTAEKIAADLTADEEVAWAEPDQFLFTASDATTSNDDPASVQGPASPESTSTTQAWNLAGSYGVDSAFIEDSDSAGEGVTVAMIDTGITNHPDLDSSLVDGYDFVSSPEQLMASRQPNAPPVAFDADYVDTNNYGAIGRDSNPADPGDWRETSPARDSSWHGSGMAGLIHDVAPGASIQPVRALSWRGGLLSDIAASITWASGGDIDGVPVNENPSKVINMSFAVEATCPVALQDAIDGARDRGSILIAAAGNASDDAAKFAPGNCTGVITVASTTEQGTRADYSNYGPAIDIAAPGGDTTTPVAVMSNTGTTTPGEPTRAGDFGTSVSASHVAAGAAIIAGKNPSITPDEAYGTLTGRDYTKAFAGPTCDTANPDYTCGTGILTLAQVATVASGDVDYAMNFDGTTQYATAPDNAAFDITGALTMEAWVKPEQCSDDWIFGKDQAYEISCRSNTFQFAISAGSFTWVDTGVTASIGEWQHIALSRGNQSSTVRFYLNGQLAYEKTNFATGSIANQATNFLVAKDAGASHFDGVVDEIRIFDDVRTQPEVEADMHTYPTCAYVGCASSGTAYNDDNLVAYYDFNEGPAGTTGTGTVFNRADNAAADTNLRTVNGPTYTDVKQTTSNGNNTVVTFPRSYLTAAGGWRVPEGVTAAQTLVVGGGGGGGAGSSSSQNAGGGGGGGGFVSDSPQVSGVLGVTVGTGGQGGVGCTTGTCTGGSAGSSSSVTAPDSSVIAEAGGGLGGGRASYSFNGDGGLGGGSGSPQSNAGVEQGTDGGGGGSSPDGIGTRGSTSGGGAGADGRASSITGSQIRYGAGGGGGGGDSSNVAGSGGSGGGGRGGTTSVAPVAGTAGLGGGGGGGAYATNNSGAAGGSGVVIVSYSTVNTSCDPFESSYIENGTVYRVLKWSDPTQTGCTWTPPSGVTSVDVLLVGGGGGGGSGNGLFRGAGGGGAGGFRPFTQDVSTGSPFELTIGAGGLAGTGGSGEPGSNGGATTAFGETAVGGGGGGGVRADTGTNADGKDGGSGGGGGNSGGAAGSGTSGEGSDGGVGSTDKLSGGAGGGGGGASQLGDPARGTTGGGDGGDGGDGRDSDITGIMVTYAGGGGGGGGGQTDGVPGSGGEGGGGTGGKGDGSTGGDDATAGIDGLGGGGGGASRSTGAGDGGDGVIIVRYEVSQADVCVPFEYSYTDTSTTPNTPYTVVEFQGAGTCSWTPPAGVTSVDYLAVGGGGGGSGGIGGGGGAGRFLTSTATVSSATPETITIGAGGAGGNNSPGTAGGDTEAFGKTLTGGGGGGTGTAGGSGGGGYCNGSGGAAVTGDGLGNTGGNGATGSSAGCVAGGGGGAGSTGDAGAPGGNTGDPTGQAGGSGGKGASSNITGTLVYYAAGGGGGVNGPYGGNPGAGGLGGGGAAGPAKNSSTANGYPGTDGTGSGGGGGSNCADAGSYACGTMAVGGDGGDGVVIVRYTNTPGVPTGLSATAGEEEVALSWTAPAHSGTSAISGYSVTVSSDGSNYSAASAGSCSTANTSTSTSCDVTGLTANTLYYFKVAAINSAGTGTTSSASTATPFGPVAKFAVTMSGGTTALSAAAKTAGTAFDVRVTAQDTNGLTNTAYTGTVTLSSTNAFDGTFTATIASGGFVDSVSVTPTIAGSNRTIAATDGSVTTPNASGTFSINAGTAVKLQVLLPGETADPGSATGKSGTPTDDVAGSGITATVNAVDANWNVVSSATPTVAITSSDGNATLPSNAALVSGTKDFSVTLTTAGSQTITATDQAGGLASSTSASVTVTPGAASVTTSTVTATPTSMIANGSNTSTVTVTLKDAYSNTLTSGGDTVVVSSDLGSVGATTDNNDGTYTATLTAGTTAGDATVSATVGGSAITDTATVTLTSAAATRLVITGSSSQTAGATQNLTITAKDSGGNTATSYTGDKTLTFSGATQAPGGQMPAVKNKSGTTVVFGTGTTIEFTNGVATVSGSNNGVMTLYAAESATIVVTDSGGLTSASAGDLAVTVSPGSAAALSIDTQPVGGAPGGRLQTQPVVHVDDAYGNTVVGDSTTDVVATIASGSGGTLGGTSTVTAASGVATFSDLTLSGNQGASYTLQFADSGSALTSVTSSSLNVDLYEDSTTDGGGWKLVAYGSSAQLGGFMNAPSGVYDPATRTGKASFDATSFFNEASEVAISWNQSGFPTGGISSYEYAVKWTLPTPSSMTLTGVSGSCTSNCTSDFTAVAITDIQGSSGLSSTQYMQATTFGVNYNNSYGITNDDVNWGPDSQNRQALYLGNANTPGSYATGYFTTNGTTSGYVPSTIAIWVRSLTSTQLGVGTAAAGAASAAAFTTQPAIEVQSSSGALVSSDNSTVVTASISGSASLIGTTTATASNGVATFNNLGITGTAGTYTLTFSSGALTVATQSITVTAGSATTIAVDAGDGQTATAGSAVSTAPSILVTDSAGNPVQGESVTFAVASGGGSLASPGSPATVTTDSSGIATSPAWTLGTTAGSNSLTATSGSLSGSPVTFTATGIPGTATRLRITGSSTQTAGVAQDLTITAQDSNGNTATGYTGDKALTFSGASAAPDGTVPTVTDKDGNAIDFGDPTTITFSSGEATVSSGDNGAMVLYQAGTSAVTIQVTDGTISAAGAYDLDVTVSAAALDSFVVTNTSSSDITSKAAGESFAVRVRAVDAFLNTDRTFTGTVDLSSTSTMIRGEGQTASFSTGLLTSTTVALTSAGSQTITATRSSGGTEAGTSNTFTVAPGAAVDLQFATQPVSGQSGQALTTQPRVAAVDAFGNVATAASGSVTVTSPATGDATRLTTSGPNGVLESAYGRGSDGVGRWVAIKGAEIYSSADGSTWSLAASHNSTFVDLAYGQDATGSPRWIAMTSTNALASSDGITWSSTGVSAVQSYTRSSCAYYLDDLAFGGGAWIAVTQRSGSVCESTRYGIFRSVDGGATWNKVSTQTPVQVAYSHGVWAGASNVGSSPTGLSVISTDGGATWTFGGSASGATRCVIAGNGTFVAIRVYGETFSTSNPAQAWTQGGGTGLATVTSCAFSGGVFVAFNGSSGDNIAVSTDGVTWQSSDQTWTPTRLAEGGPESLVFASASVYGLDQPADQLSGTQSVALSGGYAQFTDVGFAGTVGTNYRLVANGSGFVNGSASDPFSPSSPGAPSTLATTTTAAGGSSGAAFTTQPAIEIADSAGNRDTGDNSTVVTAAVSAGGTLVGTVTATASSGVATFSDLGISGTAGSYTLTFSAANVSDVTQSVTVSAGVASALSITTAAGDTTYGTDFSPQPVVTVQDSAGNTVTSWSTDITATVKDADGNTLETATATPSSGVATFSGLGSDADAGTVTVEYSSGALTLASETVLVAQAPVSVTASSESVTYGDPVPTITPSYSGFVNGQTSSVVTTPPTCTTTYTTTSAVGTAPTTSCSGAVAANYTFNYTPGTVTIGQATPTISWSNASAAYGDSAFTPTAPTVTGVTGASLAGTISYSSGDTSVVTVNSSTGEVTITGAGTSTMTATFTPTDSTNYASTSTTMMLTVTKAPLTITASSSAVSYGAAVPTVTPSYSGFVNGQGVGALSSLPTCSTTYTTTSNVGTYATTCSGAAADDYSFVYVDGTVTVSAATPSLSWSNISKTYGNAPFTLTSPTATGVTGGSLTGSWSYASSDAAVATVSGAVVTIVGAGSATLTATFTPTSSNYNSNSIGVTLAAAKASQATLTMTSPSSAIYGETVTLAASGGSGTGSILFQKDAGTCTVTGSTLTLGDAGSLCQVSAIRGGDGNYNSVTSASQTITIAKAAQTLAFTSSVPASPVSGETYTPVVSSVSAVTGSATGITPSLSVAGTCTESGGVVTFTASGNCVITASANATYTNFNAASDVTQTVAVGSINQNITFAQPSNVSFGSSSVSMGASASSGLTVTYALGAGTTNSACSVSSLGVVTVLAVGTCEVTASQAGDAQYAAASDVSRAFQVVPALPTAPTITSASASSQAITVGVAAPGFTGGVSITAYQLVATPTSGGTAVTDTSCTSGPCTISGLVNGTEYTVTVAAINSAGTGPASAASTALTPATAAFAVGSLAATPGNTFVDVTWTKPTDLGGGTFVRYDTYIKPASSATYGAPTPINPTTPGDIDTAPTNYRFTGLDNGTSYDVKVITITEANGVEIPGGPTQVVQYPSTVPSAPRSLTVLAATPTDVQFSWSAPVSDGGSVLSSPYYRITVTSTSSGATTPVVCSRASLVQTFCTASGLTNGASYVFTVEAHNRMGYGTLASTTYNVPSADASLSDLVVTGSGGTVSLTPSFASGTTTYAASVTNAVASVTVTPTTTAAGASVTVDGVAVVSGEASESLALNVGSNVIEVEVTASDPRFTQTYEVTITRAAAPVPAPGPSPSDRGGSTPVNPLPAPAPVVDGEDLAVVTEDGSVISVVLQPTAQQDGWEAVGSGFDVIVRTEMPSGAPVPLANDRRLAVPQGGIVQAAGDGYMADSLVRVFMIPRTSARAGVMPRSVSGAMFLGEATVDASGEFDASFAVPLVMAVGDYVLQINGMTANAEVRSVNMGVMVEPGAAPLRAGMVQRAGFYKGFSSEFDAAGKKKINAIAAAVPKDAQAVQVLISGVSVGLADFEENAALAAKRAAKLAKELQDAGVEGEYTITITASFTTESGARTSNAKTDVLTTETGKPLSTVTVLFQEPVNS